MGRIDDGPLSGFNDLPAISPQLLAEGYLARAVHGRLLTLAVVEVEPGAELAEHRHANEQFGLVIEGSVVFRIGDETRTVEPGGIWRIPSGTAHSVTGGEAGAVVVDVFSPPRDDWADRERLTPQPARWPQLPTRPD
jgi:quercetin dioxygenase-like cupin family protein